MKGIQRSEWGEHRGQAVERFQLENARGHRLTLTNYGATVTALELPDRRGQLADIVLGFDRLEDYVRHRNVFFGATVGRVANRIRNARFALDGASFELEANDPPHHLHGGASGWDTQVWQASLELSPRGPSVELSYLSAHAEGGYPGQVSASTRYTWTHDDELIVEMRATSDRVSIVNMAHHSYWNLGGHASGDVLGHELQLNASHYTPADPVVPVGELAPVAGTPFDFRRSKSIGAALAELGPAHGGFDHNWVIDGEPGRLRRVARLLHPGSGRVMLLEADAPGLQFYSGNFLTDAVTGKGRHKYGHRHGLCLETQAFPDAINVPAWAQQVLLRPGQQYRHEMVHRFSVE